MTKSAPPKSGRGCSRFWEMPTVVIWLGLFFFLQRVGGGGGQGEWSFIGGGRLREWLHMVQQQLTIVYTCIHRDTAAYFNKEGVLGDSLKPLFTKVQ